MISRFLLLFILVPIIELILLVRLGNFIGFWHTFLLVVILGLFGFLLARSQGFFILFRIREELARGSIPGDALLDGMLVFLGGLLLIIPGILTDVAGLSLMFPSVRAYFRRMIKLWMLNRLASGGLRIYIRNGR